MKKGKDQPLSGKRILITRTKSQAGGFAKKISRLGGIPVILPLISIQPPADLTRFREAVRQLHDFQWLVFTSQNGVDAFFRVVKQENVSFDRIKNVKIAVVGKKTSQAAEAYGLHVDVMPEGDFTAEGLLCVLLKKVHKGDRILLPRGNLARNVLPERLREFGANVFDPIAYETVINREGQHELIDRLIKREVDVITFTSSSTVHFFVELTEGVDWRSSVASVCLAAIGPITAETMKKYGLNPDVVAKENTSDGLLQEIIRYFSREEINR